MDDVYLRGSRKQWRVQQNKKQDESNVVVLNYDTIYWNVNSSLIYGTPNQAHFKDEKDKNNITIQVRVKVTP